MTSVFLGLKPECDLPVLGLFEGIGKKLVLKSLGTGLKKLLTNKVSESISAVEEEKSETIWMMPYLY